VFLFETERIYIHVCIILTIVLPLYAGVTDSLAARCVVNEEPYEVTGVIIGGSCLTSSAPKKARENSASEVITIIFIDNYIHLFNSQVHFYLTHNLTHILTLLLYGAILWIFKIKIFKSSLYDNCYSTCRAIVIITCI